jgi:hypothetical protein
MSHRPVGIGISLSINATPSLTTSFSVQSNVLRIVAVSAGAFVAIGTNPSAATTDYYIPAGQSATLALNVGSNRVTGITTGSTTTIDFAEGTQCPFGVGEYVTLTVTGQPYYNFVHVPIVSVNNSSSYDGYFSRRIVLGYNSSGIVTSYDSNNYAELRMSQRLSARTEGGTGTVYCQQVQVTGLA